MVTKKGPRRVDASRPAGRTGGVRWWHVAGVMAAAAVAVVALVALNNRGGDEPALVVRPAAAFDGIAQKGKTLGAADAPVTLVVYSDFLCPHCGEFVAGAEQRVIEEYVADGRVRIEYRHFPVFGEPAVEAAAASECAARQGRFWQYHDVLFANEGTAGRDGFGRDRLIEFGAAAGLDDGAFAACLGDPALAGAVAADQERGVAQGVRGTPALFIDGVPVASDEAAVVGAIEDALRG